MSLDKPEKIRLCAIVAMAENRVIGGDNSLLWHLPEDLKHFKKTTMGCPLIMGRKTLESLPGVLPGRPHIVISRAIKSDLIRQYGDNYKGKDVHFVNSLESAIEKAKTLAKKSGTSSVFIAGGGEIYRQAMPFIECLYLTTVHKKYEGDTTFPEINLKKWDSISSHKYSARADKNLPAFTIQVLEKD